MKVYEAVYNNKDSQGVYGISLVENPAMEDEWIALSEQKAELQFAAVDEAKRLLLGAVLIPEKKIYRNINGNEFYITFTSDTIGQLAHDFITKGNQNNSSAEHEVQLNDVSFVESWQVEDPNIDKSALYGKKYEKGTWVTMAKVSPEIYEQATNGTFKGFSIDALLGLQELKLNTNINMTKQDLKDLGNDIVGEIKTIFASNKTEDVKAEEIEVKSEEVVEEVTEATEEPQIDVLEAIKEIMAEFKSDVDAKIETLKTELSKEEVKAKDEKIEELETELAKQPEVTPIKANPVAKETTKTNPFNKYKGTKARVFENLTELWG